MWLLRELCRDSGQGDQDWRFVPSTVNSHLTSPMSELPTSVPLRCVILTTETRERERSRETVQERRLFLLIHPKRIRCSHLNALFSNLYEDSVIKRRCPLFGDREGGSLRAYAPSTVLISVKHCHCTLPKVSTEVGTESAAPRASNAQRGRLRNSANE